MCRKHLTKPLIGGLLNLGNQGVAALESQPMSGFLFLEQLRTTTLETGRHEKESVSGLHVL